MPKQEKIDRVTELKARIEGSEALLLTEYRGLSVSEITELRRSLAEGGTRFQVVKNTLMRRAVNDAGVAELEALFEGPSAVAFVEGDPVAAAKSVVDAAKKYPTLELKGGFMDGKMLSADDAKALASLESREAMLSKIAGLDEVGDVEGRGAARRRPVEVPVAARGVQGEGARRGRPEEPVAEAAEPEPEAPEAEGPKAHEERATRRPRPRPRATKRGGVTEMAKLTTDDLLEQFKEMTLLELSEFIKQFEETFDVTAAAAAPMMMAAPGGAAGRRGRRGRGAGRVRRGPHRRRRQEDPGDQGGARADEPRPQGGEGSRRRRPSARSREGQQGAADKAKEALEGAGASVEVKYPNRFAHSRNAEAGSRSGPASVVPSGRIVSARITLGTLCYGAVRGEQKNSDHGGGTRRHAVRR